MSKLKIKQKVVLVTGARRGIGKAIISRLAADGFRVVINYKDSKTHKEAASLAEVLGRKNRECLIVKADISNEAEVKNMMKKIISTFQSLDIVVHNASVNQNQSFKNLKLKDFDKVMSTNLRGAVLVARLSLRYLEESKSPRIIFISSMNCFLGSSEKVAYTVSKAGLIALARSLALELAPKTLVNTIIPGYIDTEMFREFNTKPLNERIKNIPLKRLGNPEDVASTVSFLCSDDSKYITGQCFHINGGVYLH